MFVHKSEGIFKNIFAKACPYGLKTSRNIEIKYIFSFKVRFHVFDTFYTSCPSAFNDLNSVLYILRIPKKYQFMSQIFLLSANIS